MAVYIGNDIVKAFTGGNSVKAIYSEGVKVWESNPGFLWGNRTDYFLSSAPNPINFKIKDSNGNILVEKTWYKSADDHWSDYNDIKGSYLYNGKSYAVDCYYYFDTDWQADWIVFNIELPCGLNESPLCEVYLDNQDLYTWLTRECGNQESSWSVFWQINKDDEPNSDNLPLFT